MSFFSQLGKDFAVENLNIMTEFDQSNFLLNAGNFLNDNVKTLKPNIRFDQYSHTIELALNRLSELKIDKREIANAIMLFSSEEIDKYNLNIRKIDRNDIVFIKPQYLNEYVDNIGLTINRVIKGTAGKQEMEHYNSNDMFNRVKHQMIKTTLPYSMNNQQLANYSNDTFVKVTSDYATEEFVPFLKNIDTNMRTCEIVGSDTITTINYCAEQIGLYYKVLQDTAQTIEPKKLNKLNKFMYSALRGLLDIMAFLVSICLRKIDETYGTLMEINNICEQIESLNNVPALQTEGAFDHGSLVPTDTNSLAENLIKGEVDAYTALSNRLYEFNKGTLNSLSDNQPVGALGDNLHSAFDVAVTNCEYSMDQYEEANKMYIIISQGLDLIARSSDDYLLVFDDLVNKSGFSLRLEDRFKTTISQLDDVSEYTSNASLPQHSIMDNPIYYKMLHELKDYSNNMQQLANNVLDCKTKIDMLSKRFNLNINGEFKNAEAVNELKIFMQDLNEQYKNLSVSVSGKFMNRLKSIGLTIEKMQLDVDNNNTLMHGVETVGDEIDNMTTECSIDIFESVIDLSFEQMMIEYTIAKEEKTKGIRLVLEADAQPTQTAQPQQSQGTQPQQTQTTQPANQQQTTNNDQNQKNTQTDNQTQNQDNKDAGKTGNGIKSIIDRINKWFQGVVDKFESIIQSEQAKQAQAYMTANKEALLAKNYSNASNKKPILEYEKLMPSRNLLSDSKNFANKLSKGILTPQKLQNLNDRQSIAKVVLPNIPTTVWQNDNITDSIKTYYKVGTYQENPVTLSSGQLKEIVTQAVNYCDTFYSNYLPQLKTNIESIKNNITELSESLITEAFMDTDFTAMIMEADENKNTLISMGKKCSLVQEIVQKYTAGILTAAFDRYKDYMSLLYSIIPQNTKPAQQENAEQSQETQK